MSWSRLGHWWARSLRWKLVGVFVAISVIPMLVASHFTTQFVANAFENDVGAWLVQTSHFFIANILDERRETSNIADSLVGNSSLDGLLSGNATGLPLPVSHLIDALGYDLLLITDDKGNVVFSSRPQRSLMQVPFTQRQNIYIYDKEHEPMLMAAGTSDLFFRGKHFRVLIGTFIDQSFVNNMGALSSLTIRFYYKIGDSLTQLYASQSSGTVPIPRGTLDSLEKGGGVVAATDDTSIAIYVPVRNAGALTGVVYCALSSRAGLADWIARGNLFAGIFALGMLLSVGAGLVMSRLLTHPVSRLAQGVNAIAKGDFSQRVPVRGQDELGQLAVAFNSMALQLEGLRRMEAKLRRRERMTTLGEVAAGLAHEVRNPLGIIKTSAELLEGSPNLTEVEQRRLGYVVDEVRRIDQLIRDFLAFAKPPQRMVELAPIELVNRVLGSCQHEIERQHVEVRVLDESRSAHILADRDQMIEACLNLVLNALQAMERVKVPAGMSMAPPERPRLDIRVTLEGDEVHFAFIDNGPGIPPALIDRIFDPFVTTKDEGTGLGLARVFAVAEGHNGWVEARNGPHGGAILELVVPRSHRSVGNVPDRSPR